MSVLDAVIAWADTCLFDAPCSWSFRSPLDQLSDPGSNVAAGLDARYLLGAKDHHLRRPSGWPDS